MHMKDPTANGRIQPLQTSVQLTPNVRNQCVDGAANFHQMIEISL